MQTHYPGFLAQVADKLYAKHGMHIPELTVLFPNQRAGQVFTQCLAAKITKPIWSPKILTLTTLVEQLSGLNIAPTLPLVFELYQTFQALQPSKETFEQFYGWGAMLLQDFDILDKCLVKADQLFANLIEQKKLEANIEYLTETQKVAIQTFWKSFDKRLSKHQHEFLQLWQLLPHVYTQFSKRLLAQGMCYEGLAYKTAYQELQKGNLAFNHQKLAIIGFNALHAAEEQLFILFQAKASVDFYWDVDAYYMEDAQQEAGHYLRAHQRKPYFQQSFQKPFPAQIKESAKSIKIFAVASEVGQAQVVGHQLQKLIQDQGTAFQPSQTAIILAHEGLFLPMLHALPASIRQISTTLGYPLGNTAIYQLLEQLLALQITITQPTCPPGYLPTQAVLDILNHPPIRQSNEEVSAKTSRLLKQQQTTYTNQADLTAINSLYHALFKSIHAPENIIQYLLDCLLLLDKDIEQATTVMLPTEPKALSQLYQQLSKLQQLIVDPCQIALQDFLQLFRQLIMPMQVNLNEDSLAGIQILRVWETSNLDFTHVFIVGMNEGALPSATSQGSFIPYNLRKGYGLPTPDTFQASLDAYYFYRLLQRSQNLLITYSTQSLANNNQEMSRYLWQLCYETKLPIEKHFIAYPIQGHTISPIIIEKSKQVIEALDQFMVKPNQAIHRLTPSALNSYLTCSLQFYFRYIAKLKKEFQVQKENEALLFGNLFHQVLEKLYTPLVAKKNAQLIQKKDLAALQTQIKQVIQATFAQSLHQGEPALTSVQEPHAIAQAAMSKLIDRLIELDKAYAPFELMGLEVGRAKKLSTDFVVDDKSVIGLCGIIDRIDFKQGTIRIIDYKTGHEEKKIERIDSLFDHHAPHRNKSAFQLLFYAWLYQQNQDQVAYKIVPTMMNTKSLFEAAFDPRLSIKQASGNQYSFITDISPYQGAFEANLRTILQELMNPDIPFKQTADPTPCKTCAYKGICQR